MTDLFRSPEGAAKIAAWFDRFRAMLTVPTESRTVATRFGDTHVLVGGPAAAPPVVLLHGALASSAHLLVELAPLLERFRVYAVDVIGQSVKSAGVQLSVKNDDHGRWLEDVLDGLGLERAAVIGVSWGGFVAIRLAIVAPQRIGKLVLLVPAGVVSGPAWQGLTRMMIPMLLYRMFPSERRREAFLRHLLTTPDDAWAPYLGDAFLAYRMNMRVPPLAKVEELAGLTAPVLVFGADQDLSFPGPALLARARALFPNLAGAELLKDCRHCPPTTDDFRRALAAQLAAFLAEPLGAQAAAG